jgi:Cu2+-exporting ATPase
MPKMVGRKFIRFHKVLDANGITMTENKDYYTLSFAMDPRPAMDLLKDYQPSLSSWSEAMELSDGVKQDLVRACIKPIASSICVVPILVLAWADLDHRKRNIYNNLSLGFTSTIMLISQSMFSSSIRSVLYLRQVDTSLLVSVSTVVAYTYSICAYSLQLGDIDFDDPFFETPALLLAIVIFRHAVQAFARNFLGSAIRALQNLEIDRVILVQADGTIEPMISGVCSTATSSAVTTTKR